MKFAAIFVFVFLSLMMILVITINNLALPGILSEIEQVRADIQKVDASKAEDLVGQAVELNRQIVSNQQYNKLWWAAWAIPDGWDSVKTIEINNTVKGENK